MKIFKKVYPKLKAGDCLIHSSLVVHGSERNLSNKPRRGFTLRFIAQNDKFDVFKMRNYKKSLIKSIRGKQYARVRIDRKRRKKRSKQNFS